MLVVDASDQGFRRDAFLLGAQHDRRAMSIIGADVSGLVANQFLETDPDIGLNVFDQMTQMDGPVSVGQRGSNKQRTFHGRDFS